MINFTDLPLRSQMLGYLKMTFEHDPKAIFCTSNIAHIKAAEDLIKEGLIVEIEGPGGDDRAFGLTSAGKTHLNITD